MEYLVRKVPHKIGPPPLPMVLTSAADLLDDFADRDNLIDAPVVAGPLRSLLLALQAGQPWEPDAEETTADRLDQHFRDVAGGEEAARKLARGCIINADKSITIPQEHGLLLVRMCSALGAPGPYLVDLMRRARKGSKSDD